MLSELCWCNNAIAVLVFVLHATTANAQLDIDRAPISYSSKTPSDRVYKLGLEIEAGTIELQWDEGHGWLPALMETLGVPKSSQTLVFSKTSLQIRKISPARPRALYFNDDVYIGWVQRGDFVELSAVDPQQGAMFYKMKQDPKAKKIIRDNGECLACHATRRTQQVPGFLVRSALTKADGHPEFRLGTTTTDHTTDFKKRFGGWYVTGQHGDMRHLGNAILAADRTTVDHELHANRDTLPKQVRASSYLADTSDIVALMVLEHQSQMHNWMTRAAYTARQALHQQAEMNRVLDRPSDYRSESTMRRIETATEKLLEYMLFRNEFQLTSPVSGNSSFATEFTACGLRDAQGRSLRDFDLQTRMFRYPCSFLIYSDSFRELPETVRSRLKDRLLEVLTAAPGEGERFAHLTKADRQNILSILQETHWMFQSESVSRNGASERLPAASP